MRVLLINPDIMQPPVIPIGLRYIAAALKEEGHIVECLDLYFVSWEQLEDEIISTVDRFLPEAIGISLRNLDVKPIDGFENLNLANYNLANYNLTNYNISNYNVANHSEIAQIEPEHSNAEIYSKVIKCCQSHSPVPIIIGGSGFTLKAEQFIKNFPKCIGVVGPGEQTLKELISVLERGGEYVGVAGIVFQRNERLVNNVAQCEPFAKIPLPRLPDLNHWSYREYLKLGAEMNIQTKRGCEFRCVYCSYPLVEGRQVRLYDPEIVVDQIEEATKLGIDKFRFVDSVFNNPISHAEKICKLISDHGIDLKELTVNCSPGFFTRELAKKLKLAGCTKVIFGTDHGSERMLRILNKPFRQKQIEEISTICREISLPFQHDLLLGAPGETEESVREGLEFMRSLDSPVYVDMGIQVYENTEVSSMTGMNGRVYNSTIPPIFIDPKIADRLAKMIVTFCDNSPNMHTFIRKERDNPPCRSQMAALLL